MTTILAIILVPFIYIINAFFVGRLIKRKYLTINSFLATTIGFLALMCFFNIFFFFFFLLDAIILIYVIFIATVQTILIIFYIFNWKFTIISTYRNWKTFIIFACLFCSCFLISWLCQRPYESSSALEIINSFYAINPDMLSSINLSLMAINFNTLYIFDYIWVTIFNISGQVNIDNFANWSYVIIGSFFVSTISIVLFSKVKSWKKMALNILLVCLLVACSLMFYESFFITNSWSLILIVLYLYLTFSQTIKQEFKLWFLFIVLWGIVSICGQSLFIIFGLFIFSIYYFSIRKNDPINHMLWLLYPVLLCLSYWTIDYTNVYALIIVSILDAFYLILFTITMIFKFNIKTSRINEWISVNVNRIKYLIGIIFILLIIFLTLYQIWTEYEWNFSVYFGEFERFFYVTYTSIFGINCPLHGPFMIFLNCFLFVIYATMIILYFVFKAKNNKLFENAHEFRLMAISVLIFLNPISMNLLNSFNSIITYDNDVINVLFWAPAFLFGWKTINQWKIKPFLEWNYDWY